jgi:hypothetical protein
VSLGVVQIVGWVLSMWFIVRPLGVAWARRAEAQAALSRTEMTALITVFGALGAERVAHGLTATGHSWNDCFLTRATVAPPRRTQALQPLGRGLAGWWPGAHARLLGALLGSSPRAVRSVARAWDSKEVAFRALAAEWLEEGAWGAARASAPQMVA